MLLLPRRPAGAAPKSTESKAKNRNTTESKTVSHPIGNLDALFLLLNRRQSMAAAVLLV